MLTLSAAVDRTGSISSWAFMYSLPFLLFFLPFCLNWHPCFGKMASFTQRKGKKRGGKEDYTCSLGMLIFRQQHGYRDHFCPGGGLDQNLPIGSAIYLHLGLFLDQLYQRSEIKKKGCFHKLLSEKGLLRGNLTPLAALNGYLVKREAEFIWWRSRMGQNPRAHVAAHYDGFFGRVPLWASLKPLPSENSHSIVALWCKCYQICKKKLKQKTTSNYCCSSTTNMVFLHLLHQAGWLNWLPCLVQPMAHDVFIHWMVIL